MPLLETQSGGRFPRTARESEDLEVFGCKVPREILEAQEHILVAVSCRLSSQQSRVARQLLPLSGKISQHQAAGVLLVALSRSRVSNDAGTCE